MPAGDLKTVDGESDGYSSQDDVPLNQRHGARQKTSMMSSRVSQALQVWWGAKAVTPT